MLFITPLLPSVYAASGGSDNLPVYTSPIDVTGLRIELHAVAPDRNTGAPIEVPLPVGLLGPKMKLLVSTPLSTAIDQYWSVIPDPKTGMTPRESACKGPKGIIYEVGKTVREIGSGYGAYDISCNLAFTGKLLVKQAGSTLYFAYLLTHNTVDFTVATPYTCHKGHGTLACPADPHLQVTFASEIGTVVRAPGFCSLSAEGGTVTTQSATIDGSNNLTGALAQLVDNLLLGHKFSRAERAIEATQQQQLLPLDSSFKELRDSDACTGKNPALRRAFGSFRDFEAIVQPAKGIINLQVRHAGITAPTVGAPDPWSTGGRSQPTFIRPSISTDQPLVIAGNSLQIRGQSFPANTNMNPANRLPISFSHGGYGANSIVLGGVCFGGYTEVQWGLTFGATHVAQVAGDAQGTCATTYEVNNLNPATPYQIRARDCDAITCSPWSSALKVMTAAAGADKGTGGVTLSIDSAAACNAPWCRSAASSGIAANAAPSVSNSPLSRSARISGLAGNRQPSACSGPLCRPASTPAISSVMAGNTPLGSATLTPQGTFVATVFIPAGIPAGTHTIRAFSADANAEVAINVSAPNGGGGKASIIVVGLLKGESGCPNHPVSSTATDANFTMFGAGFAAGPVTIYLDRASGHPFGAATVRPDGTFCQQMPGVFSTQAGAHSLLAAQNGAILAQTSVTFVQSSVVH